MSSYDPQKIEKKWQDQWESDKIYQANLSEVDNKFYSLVMFPYPSGDLHIGHWYSYTGPDIYARYHRMNGKNVLHPFGFDAFGLPAENAAIKRGFHPHDWTQLNISGMIDQLKMTGISFDWSKVVDTSDPNYYRWTQWMFLKLYEKGLAYRRKGKVNWCETDQTVLANEQVENGLCWRCGNPVMQKDLEQWYFKTTAYAEELLDDLKGIDWPEQTKTMQANWIGKSQGAEIEFELDINANSKKIADEGGDQQDKITVFTTRPDTLMGVSYIVLAPEHDLVTELTTPEQQGNVETYIEQTKLMSDRDRLIQENDKTGVFTGGYAIHPISGDKVPVWIASYVLSTYGTGAVMGVPAHDQRDYDFAHKYDLPIIQVVDGAPNADSAYIGDGKLINSGEFNGLIADEAKKVIIEALAEQGKGRAITQYRLRDWLVSRQRYWGAPIPMVECSTCGMVPVDEKDLPVVLPREVDFMPKGQPPLATNVGFMNVECPRCHRPAQRVAETMDTFVDSSWYFFRYLDSHNQNEAFSQKVVDSWMPVDVYVGGAEHTVLHLLYSRFFTKAFRDMGYHHIDEPFAKLRHQGMILGPDHQKMSKSKGNVVNPDDLVRDFGTDAVRMQLVFMGPYDQGGPWQLTGIHGVFRFLQRVWTFHDSQSGWPTHSSPKITLALNRAIQKISGDIEQFKFNTGVATLMSTLNVIAKEKTISKQDWQAFLKLLAPFAPHISEELWHRLGNKDSIHRSSWPQSSEATDVSETTSRVVVQINGKVRAIIQLPDGVRQDQVIKLAQGEDSVKKYLEGKRTNKVIYIPGRVLNFVVTDA